MLAASGRLDNFLQLIGALLIFVFVLAITYFVTRWIGNYQKVQWKNRNMQVIETMRIANNKFIQIVKVSEEYLVISIGKDTVELLTKLDERSIEALNIPQQEARSESFQEVLKKLRGNMKK